MNPYALWAPAPQAGASANFATPARGELYKYSKIRQVEEGRLFEAPAAESCIRGFNSRRFFPEICIFSLPKRAIEPVHCKHAVCFAQSLSPPASPAGTTMIAAGRCL